MLRLTKILSAFNAILSASVVALGVSYAIPPAINCLRGRKMLPPRPFILPGPLGWMCNLLGIAYVIVTTVLFLFPPDLPVTGSNMSMSFFTFTLHYILSHLVVTTHDLFVTSTFAPLFPIPSCPSSITPSIPLKFPLNNPQPLHTLTTSNPRLLHRRLLHRHRHKRSAMVRRRPQKLQRSRCGIGWRRRRARLRRRQCRRQV